MCVVIRNMYIDWSIINKLLHLCLGLGFPARNVCLRVTLGCDSLIRFLVTLFVVVVLVAGPFCI